MTVLDIRNAEDGPTTAIRWCSNVTMNIGVSAKYIRLPTMTLSKDDIENFITALRHAQKEQAYGY